MFCKFCGNELPEGANFCTKCGKVVSPDDIPAAGVSAPVTAEYEYVPYEEPQDAERDSRGGSILKFAILGLAFACSLIHRQQACFRVNFIFVLGAFRNILSLGRTYYADRNRVL